MATAAARQQGCSTEWAGSSRLQHDLAAGCVRAVMASTQQPAGLPTAVRGASPPCNRICLHHPSALAPTFLSAVASSDRVKLATALVDSCVPLRSAYSRTLAMMYSEKFTRSPASPEMANRRCESTGTSLSSSCFIVTIDCTALVSEQTMTKSRPRMPHRKSWAGGKQGSDTAGFGHAGVCYGSPSATAEPSRLHLGGPAGVLLLQTQCCIDGAACNPPKSSKTDRSLDRPHHGRCCALLSAP